MSELLSMILIAAEIVASMVPTVSVELSSLRAAITLMRKVAGFKFRTILHPRAPQCTVSDMCMALAEAQTPIDFTINDNAGVLAFPTKFPLARRKRGKMH